MFAWLAPPVLSRVLLHTWRAAGELGDAFGLSTSLFSGLAFLGVVYSLWQQRLDAVAAEDRRQREQATALDQIHQLALATQLQSTRALIIDNRRAIEQLNPAIDDVPVSPQRLTQLIAETTKEAQSNASLRKNANEIVARLEELVELQQDLARVRKRLLDLKMPESEVRAGD
jgi:CHASE3 domain sensor protein